MLERSAASLRMRPEMETSRAEEYVCWSRMQAEAGQQLEAIIERKERERQAGNGVFFWGVGNAPSVLINALARMERAIPVVFSKMKGRPKTVDLEPGRTVVWRQYIDVHGNERPLPAHALVTSRGDSGLGPKTRHFALICFSVSPLALSAGTAFDPNTYRNAGGTGAPVGASQVTALLRRTAATMGDTPYEINLHASLVGSCWVRLTDPVELSTAELREIAVATSSGNDWIDLVTRLRKGDAALHSSDSAKSQLF